MTVALPLDPLTGAIARAGGAAQFYADNIPPLGNSLLGRELVPVGTQVTLTTATDSSVTPVFTGATTGAAGHFWLCAIPAALQDQLGDRSVIAIHAVATVPGREGITPWVTHSALPTTAVPAPAQTSIQPGGDPVLRLHAGNGFRQRYALPSPVAFSSRRWGVKFYAQNYRNTGTALAGLAVAAGVAPLLPEGISIYLELI